MDTLRGRERGKEKFNFTKKKKKKKIGRATDAKSERELKRAGESALNLKIPI